MKTVQLIEIVINDIKADLNLDIVTMPRLAEIIVGYYPRLMRLKVSMGKDDYRLLCSKLEIDVPTALMVELKRVIEAKNMSANGLTFVSFANRKSWEFHLVKETGQKTA